MIERLDAWVGRMVFHPPIIATCQRLGTTQHAFSRWVRVLIFVPIAWLLRSIPMALLATLPMFIMSVFVAIHIDRDTPVKAVFEARIVLWAVMLALLIGFVQETDIRFIALFVIDLGFQFAEYAGTIKTIPPREERKAKLAESLT